MLYFFCWYQGILRENERTNYFISHWYTLQRVSSWLFLLAEFQLLNESNFRFSYISGSRLGSGRSSVKGNRGHKGNTNKRAVSPFEKNQKKTSKLSQSMNLSDTVCIKRTYLITPVEAPYGPVLFLKIGLFRRGMFPNVNIKLTYG